MQDENLVKQNKMKFMPLFILQLLCLGYIIFSGPIVTNNILVLSFEVFAVFLIVWTLWTIKFDNFSLLKQSTNKSRLVPKGPFVYIRYPIIYSLDNSFYFMDLQRLKYTQNTCLDYTYGICHTN